MKNIKITFLFSFITCFSYSQDTIFKRSGDIIIVKVIEISPKEVKYKKIDFQDGPTYVDFKSSIKEIHFSSGYKEIFAEEEVIQTPKTTINYGLQTPTPSQRIDVWGSRFKYQNSYLHENQMHSMLLGTKDKRLIGLVGKAKDAKNMQYIGFAGVAFGVASYYYLLRGLGLFSNSYNRSNSNSYFTTSGFFLAAAVACPIVSGINKAKRNQYNREAVRLYNERF